MKTHKKSSYIKRKNLVAVGAVTYYEKTTQCKGSLPAANIFDLLGSGVSITREGRFDLENGNFRKEQKKTYTLKV